ncbi:hypothetical protein J6590_009667 [Homalodisca vitripennis]|nr:hypothetical protein J6590_009667 [Homalodisca vitripennis]
MRESFRGAFRELGLVTLPSLHILEVILYCFSKCSFVRDMEVHNYETRGVFFSAKIVLAQHIEPGDVNPAGIGDSLARADGMLILLGRELRLKSKWFL